MALANIITEIVALVAAADSTVAAMAYARYTPDEKSRNETYVKSGVLHCAIVTREASAARDRGAGADNVRDQHLIAIHCYRAVTSATDSEKKLQDLAEAVRNKLRLNRKLPNAAGWLSAPPQVRAFNAVMFANAVLCWHAEITVLAEEVLQGG